MRETLLTNLDKPIYLGVALLVLALTLFLKHFFVNGISPTSKWWGYKNDIKLVEALLKSKSLDKEEQQKIFKLHKEITYSVLTRDSRPLGFECASQWDNWPQSVRETFAKCRSFFIQRGNFEFTPRKAFQSRVRLYILGVFCVLVAAIFSVPAVVMLLYISIQGLAENTHLSYLGVFGSAVCLFIAYLYISLAYALDDFERFQKFQELQSQL
jgi:hypothetical protein